MQALRELSGAAPMPVVNGIVDSGSFRPRLAPGAFASLFGDNLAALTHEWGEAIWDGKTLPTMLGGLQVRFNGKNAAVAFVRNDQVNVIVPPDLAPGTVEVEVFARNGIWRGTADVRASAPALFGYIHASRFYPAALLAGTATYIAPTGALSGVSSRTARAGDLVELYATGLGPTQSTVPATEVLDRAYPIADLAALRVSVGGLAAEVLSAGATMAGAFKVIVRAPAGLAPGDQPLLLQVGDDTAQDAWLPLGTD